MKRLLTCLLGIPLVCNVAFASEEGSKALQINNAAGGDQLTDFESIEEQRLYSEVDLFAEQIANRFKGRDVSLSKLGAALLEPNVRKKPINLDDPPSTVKPWLAAWHPVDENPDPKALHTEIMNDYKSAVKSTLDELGFKYREYEMENPSNVETTDNPSEFKHTAIVMFESEEYGCHYREVASQRLSSCAIGIQAGGLSKAQTPSFIESGSEQSWQAGFPSEHHIVVLQYDTVLPRLDMHQAFSEKLGPETFMFMPDSLHYIAFDEQISVAGYPFWFHQGEQLLFIE